ncbi:hypothetical protein BDY21DRAFT_395018 [Lineolata rhizophorae]|uniref:Uncharacterized protein n=1 Tax=Lineolata rhizophorae TaxID=578093 RepID=A0A6A6NVH1_9PEZI|nr:hypothetical protein BDY21DRAFT_395018 [Lineolata rhizophorae]
MSCTACFPITFSAILPGLGTSSCMADRMNRPLPPPSVSEPRDANFRAAYWEVTPPSRGWARRASPNDEDERPLNEYSSPPQQQQQQQQQQQHHHKKRRPVRLRSLIGRRDDDSPMEHVDGDVPSNSYSAYSPSHSAPATMTSYPAMTTTTRSISKPQETFRDTMGGSNPSAYYARERSHGTYLSAPRTSLHTSRSVREAPSSRQSDWSSPGRSLHQSNSVRESPSSRHADWDAYLQPPSSQHNAYHQQSQSHSYPTTAQHERAASSSTSRAKSSQWEPFDDAAEFNLFAEATAGLSALSPLSPETPSRAQTFPPPTAPSRALSSSALPRWPTAPPQPAPSGALRPDAPHPPPHHQHQQAAHQPRAPSRSQPPPTSSSSSLSASVAAPPAPQAQLSRTPSQMFAEAIQGVGPAADIIPPDDDELPNYAQSQMEASAQRRREAARRAAELEERWAAARRARR